VAAELLQLDDLTLRRYYAAERFDFARAPAIIERKTMAPTPKVPGSGTVVPVTLNSFAMFNDVGIHPLFIPVVLSAMGNSIPG
jgi:hypothetical protein